MSSAKKLSRLFSSVLIGGMELKNRIVMAPMINQLGAKDGFLTERAKDYFVRRAIGGAALIIVGDVAVASHSHSSALHDAIWDDTFIPPFKELADGIHDAGAKLCLQLMHVGSEGNPAITGVRPQAPSAMVSPLTGQQTEELSKEQIQDLVRKFGEAAARARKACADMVEIQAAQGFLIHNFLTPLFNKRTDEYGGDIEGRARFVLETIKSVKERAGFDYPVGVRMVASDLVEGGLTVKDTAKIASLLARAGADAIHCTAGAGHHLSYLGVPPVDAGKACIVDLVGEIKTVVEIPVFATQRIIDPLQAEQILKDGKADVVSLGRALLCDPDWPKKAAQGDLEDIFRCIGCCQGCLDEIRKGKSFTCLGNPELGKEKEYRIRPAKQAKRVFIIGGGPGGMEAARTAALRGHEVTLYEKGKELGGQWNLACVLPRKEEFKEVIRYYTRQLEKHRVTVKLNQQMTPKALEEMNPDVVIVATGSTAVIPEIPGIDRENVFAAHDILAKKAEPIGNKLAVLGGGLVGCETAEFLAAQGKGVTIVEPTDKFAADVGVFRKPFLMEGLSKGGVKILTSMKIMEIREEGIIAQDKEGRRKNIGAYDTIVLALGSRSVNAFSEQTRGMRPGWYVIGDALEPRTGLEAIAEGSRVGREI
jgi:2,4-dienoyl-CoA reductase-like NADH-dependent reductase (Old Yellow Enzyme family)/thioredoxin reductase